MGIESRDYIRENQPVYGFTPRQGGLWAVKYLLIANIAVFLLQMMFKDAVAWRRGHLAGGLTEWLSLSLSNLLSEDLSSSFQIWRLVTYGFCHGSFTHILFNMFVLWMFGRIVEPIYGSREFLFFYLAGVVISGMCHVGMQAVTQQPSGVVGASGGVMAVVFLTAMVFPRMQVYVMFVIPMQLWVMAVIYAAVDVFGAFNTTGSKVAHFAHLGGAGFGIAYKYFGWRLSGLWDVLRFRFRRRFKGSKPKVKIYRPPTASRADLDRQVDEILEKIHKQGEASLTDRERKILTDASRRYRGS